MAGEKEFWQVRSVGSVRRARGWRGGKIAGEKKMHGEKKIWLVRRNFGW